MLSTTEEKLIKAVEFIKTKTDFVPEIAITLGSGLGELASHIENAVSVSYSEIPEFPVSTVSGHKGRLVFGYLFEKKIVALEGRLHYYEGYSMQEVVMPLRLCRMLGAKTLILSNAAGGLNLDFNVGDLMVIEDHISLFVPSPLIGPNIDSFGVRFPDMSEPYSKELIEKLNLAAEKTKIPLKRGVYVQVGGPHYESPAEIKMLRTFADAVGMSTACEAVAAKHAGMEIVGISLITDVPGKEEEILTHEKVTKVANEASEKFIALIKEFVKII